MDIHELISKAENEGLVSLAKYVNKNFKKDEAIAIISAVRGALEKKSTFLKIDVDEGPQKKLMVDCPLFGKKVHIEDVCYGCRYNPATGRWEGKDGEYFQCNYVPGSPTDVWPATRTVQGPKSLGNAVRKKSSVKQAQMEGIFNLKDLYHEIDNLKREMIYLGNQYKGVDVEIYNRLFSAYKKILDAERELGKVSNKNDWEMKKEAILSAYDEAKALFLKYGTTEESLFREIESLEEADRDLFRDAYPDESTEDSEPNYTVYFIANGAEENSFYFFDDEYAYDAFEIGQKIIDLWEEPLEEGDGVFLYDNFSNQVIDRYPDNTIGGNLASSSKIRKEAQTGLQEAEKIEQEMEADKVSLPDEDDLAYFKNMSREELEKQLVLYTELSKVLVENTFGDDMITRSEALHIVDYIKDLLGQTPEALENSETGVTVEEVPPEEVDALREKMQDEFDENEIQEVAASFWKKRIPPSIVLKEEAEKEASRLGFVKMERIVKSAPDVLERCITKVMNENKGKKGFTKSNAIAICVSSLRNKYPSVEEWVHKKKSEVEKMKKLEDRNLMELGIKELREYLDKLNEAEFVVRSSMNINDDKTIVEGTKLIKKIAVERARVNELLNQSMNVTVFDAKPVDSHFEPDVRKIASIDHPIIDEFKETKSSQEKFDWETYMKVAPKLIVEQNEILRNWPALMAEAARQEILPKISTLPNDKKQEIFIKFLESVELERKKVTGESKEDLSKEDPPEEESNQEKTSKKKKCRHMNEDNTFKGGFDGCVAHFMECKGLKKDNAERLCAYINRRKQGDGDKMKKINNNKENSGKIKVFHYKWGAKSELLPVEWDVSYDDWGDWDTIMRFAEFDPNDEEVEIGKLTSEWNNHPAGSLVVSGLTTEGHPFSILEKATNFQKIQKKAQQVGVIKNIVPEGTMSFLYIEENGKINVYPAETNGLLRSLEAAFGNIENAIDKEISFELTDFGTISAFDTFEE